MTARKMQLDQPWFYATDGVYGSDLVDILDEPFAYAYEGHDLLRVVMVGPDESLKEYMSDKKTKDLFTSPDHYIVPPETTFNKHSAMTDWEAGSFSLMMPENFSTPFTQDRFDMANYLSNNQNRPPGSALIVTPVGGKPRPIEDGDIVYFSPYWKTLANGRKYVKPKYRYESMQFFTMGGKAILPEVMDGLFMFDTNLIPSRRKAKVMPYGNLKQMSPTLRAERESYMATLVNRDVNIEWPIEHFFEVSGMGTSLGSQKAPDAGPGVSGWSEIRDVTKRLK
jgi:hypothetical protein